MSYEENGFVIMRSALDKKLLQTLAKDLFNLFSSDGRECVADCQEVEALMVKQNEAAPERLFEITQKASLLTSYQAVARELLGVLEIWWPDQQVTELTSGLLFGFPNNHRITYGWHQESNYWVDYALDVPTGHFPVVRDATRHNGTMSVLKGSHRNGTLPYKAPVIEKNSTKTLVPLCIDQLVESHEEVFLN